MATVHIDMATRPIAISVWTVSTSAHQEQRKTLSYPLIVCARKIKGAEVDLAPASHSIALDTANHLLTPAGTWHRDP